MCVGLTEWAPNNIISQTEKNKAGLCCECTGTLPIFLQVALLWRGPLLCTVQCCSGFTMLSLRFISMHIGNVKSESLGNTSLGRFKLELTKSQ